MIDAPIQSLFQQIDTLFDRYQKINELTGEDFNVFRILKLEASEVRMHSAFLAELLNQKGSHGQKDVFLKLFIKRFCFKGNHFDTDNSEVIVEKYIGTVNHVDTEGGRIDICIRDKYNNYIIIENKIYASDQTNQLLRYHKYANHADLFYLSLEGNSPSNNSKGILKENKDFKCLSYQENIIHWLEDCRKEVAVLPMVREAISHYINLIKFLTNQTTNHNMEQELTQLMQSNIKASFAIAGNLNHTLQQLSYNFGVKVEEALNRLGVEVSYDFDFSKNYSGIWIWKEEWEYVNIGFQFQSRNRDLIYGFAIKSIDGKKPITIPSDLWSKLGSLPNNKKRTSEWWPWFNDVRQPYKDWNRYEAYEAIHDGSMLKMLIEETNILLKITQGIKL